MSVVYSKDLILQIFILIFSVFAQIVIICFVKPYSGGLPANRMELFNEVMLVSIMYTMQCFSDFIPDPETKYYVGYVSCGLVVFHLLVNVVLMIK